MRGRSGARFTALAITMMVLGCAHPPPRRLSTQRATPRVIVVQLETVAFRSTAWVELHVWLATAARSADELSDPELESAARAYRAVLRDDDHDALLQGATRALQTCEDQRCAEAAIAPTRFAAAYLAALPTFLTRHWTRRATLARNAMEVARAALGPEVEAIAKKVAEDLAIDGSTPARVDIVGEAPPPGPEAPIPILLSGSCFSGARGETMSVHDARIIDCALAYAFQRLDSRSALAVALEQELRAGGHAEDFRAAWSVLVVHAVATVVTGLEPRHASVLRRSAASVLPVTLAWLAQEWPARMHGEPARAFAKRYAAAFRNGS